MQAIRTGALRVCKKLLILALAVGPLAAMSASQDGSVVVFAENNKIVRWRLGRRADLVGDRDRQAPVITGALALLRFTTNPYLLRAPQVSPDGRTVRYLAEAHCWNRCSINFPQVYAGAEWTEGEPPVDLAGAPNASPDGRFLRLTVSFSSPGLVTAASVQDRLTGTIVTSSGGSKPSVPVSGRLVANDGTFVGHHHQIVRADRSEILLAETVSHLALTADGQAVVYAEGTRVRRRSLRSNADVLVYQSPEPVDGLDISDDASVVLIKTSSGQAILLLAGSSRVVASSDVKAVAVAGNGTVAFVQERQGPLHRLVLTGNGGVRDEPFHWYPVVRTDWRGVAGSQVRLAAAGLYPGVAVKAYLNGVEAPVVDPNPTDLRLQIPWEFATRPAGTQLNLVIEQGGEVTSRSLLTLTEPQPEFVGFAEGAPLVYQDDQITLSQSARPGEVVHATVLGLGVADAPLATGQVSPADPLARTPAVTCVAMRPGGRPEEPLDLHYAGLIPNEVGLYRISLRIPFVNRGSSGLTLRCRVGEGAYSTLDIR